MLIRLYQRQLAELQKQATDTHELAIQAKNQADGTKEVADRALIQANATSQLAVQARKSNDLAHRALDTAAEASKADQRAWFGIDDFEILQYDPDDPKKPFRMQINFKNTGKTPARQIHVLGWNQVYKTRFDSPTDADWNAFLVYFNKSSERYAAAPNAIRKYIIGEFRAEDTPFRTLYEQHFLSIKTGSEYLYFFGQATYVDNDNRPRTTKFCLLLADRKTKQLAYCGKGNDMD